MNTCYDCYSSTHHSNMNLSSKLPNILQSDDMTLKTSLELLLHLVFNFTRTDKIKIVLNHSDIDTFEMET